jgi:hypothetical protein
MEFEPVYNRPEAPGRVWSVKAFLCFDLGPEGPRRICFILVSGTADGATQHFERFWHYVMREVINTPFDSASPLTSWLEIQRRCGFVLIRNSQLEPFTFVARKKTRKWGRR